MTLESEPTGSERSVSTYDVMVVRTNRKQVAAGRWVRDKREAEWLAATIKKQLGLLGRRGEVPASHSG
jgi:hypothetical protein